MLLAVVAAVWYWRKSDGAPVITEQVTQGSIRSVVNAGGTVQAVLTVRVGSIEDRSKPLRRFPLEVKRGAVLA